MTSNGGDAEGGEGGACCDLPLEAGEAMWLSCPVFGRLARGELGRRVELRRGNDGREAREGLGVLSGAC